MIKLHQHPRRQGWNQGGQQHRHQTAGLKDGIEIRRHIGQFPLLFDQLPGGPLIEITIGLDRQLEHGLGGGSEVQLVHGGIEGSDRRQSALG